MNDRSPPAVGIDLATTCSTVAHLDDAGRPCTIPNSEGNLTTPSVVLFDDGGFIVGEEALLALAAEPRRIALAAKRDMGKRVYRHEINGRPFPPEVLQACILAKLKADAEQKLGAFRHAVITVPAYFDESRRKATQDAGYMAGLEVLDIINEPTAAAMALGFQEGTFAGGDSGSRRILVYDLGGGTFDVTIMQIDGRDFTALATDGDAQLGGQDWDYRLVDHVSEQFIRQHGVDPRQDFEALARLWRNCEAAKRILSSRQEASICCEVQGRAQRIKVTRGEFEDLTLDLTDRTMSTVRQTLRLAGLEWRDIDSLLLVGGSTRMPVIRRLLAEESGKEVGVSVSADEAVAQGAALRAGVILAESRGLPAAFRIVNVNSHSLGVAGIEKNSKVKRNAIILPRNTPLPASTRRRFRTERDNQRSIRVEIVEGECPAPEGCLALGTFVVGDLPPHLPAGSPVEVEFRYQANGRLNVHVQVVGSNCALQHELVRENTLTQEQLDGWRTFLADHLNA